MHPSVPILTFALIAATAGAQTLAQPESLQLGFPGKPWTFQIAAPGFAASQKGMKPDGRAYLLASNGGYNLSVTLERVPGGADLDGCEKALRARAKSTGPIKFSGVKHSTLADMAVLEYRVAKFQGMRIEQENVVGCFTKEDVYADVHVSKVSFSPAERPILMKILTSASFAAAPSTGVSSHSVASALLAQGSSFYLRGQLDESIEPYQRALDMEKEKEELSSLHLRVLIDNLAMAYGVTGNLDRAEEVLQYGLSRDSTYPMFYYILANVYAERNDLDSTLRYLRLALAHRENVIPGESLPDPLEDDSFTRFGKNSRFTEVAAEFR